MLSTFESALLDRHLRGCPECSAFAVDAEEQTSLLRSAVLELPTRPILVPSESSRAPRRAAGVLSACLVAAAAAAVVVWPGARSGGLHQASAGRVGAPVPVVVPAEPSLASANVVVPRLKMQPASIADGPVHGYFSTPV
jgi:predicted anti-sigma-YlaC factor YlaD